MAAVAAVAAAANLATRKSKSNPSIYDEKPINPRQLFSRGFFDFNWPVKLIFCGEYNKEL